MDQWRARLKSFLWRCDRLEHFVFNIDELGCLASDSLCFGNDAGDDVAAATRFFADLDIDWPVFFDETAITVARHVGCRHNAMDTFERERPRSIDREHFRSRIVR